MPDQTDNTEVPKSVDSALELLLAASSSAPDVKFWRRILRFRSFIFTSAVFVVLIVVIYTLQWRAPQGFPSGIQITISEGMTLGEAAVLLAEKNVIRSPFWFNAWSVLLSGESGLKAGKYHLSAPISVPQMAVRLTRGIENVKMLRVTIPEGLSNTKIAALLEKALPDFDGRRFQELAAKREGYLFPDTYIFPANATPEQIIEEMKQNFERRTSSLQARLQDFARPLHEVLTMASLIEGEVRTAETRKQVSGILWKRLKLNMPLQVDAVFPYIIGKNTFEVTLDDLKIDSPYNTYLHTGLPPGPINNPSLDAIIAAITPTDSEYLYYLTDNDGNVRYATTHAEHLINRAKYLGK